MSRLDRESVGANWVDIVDTDKPRVPVFGPMCIVETSSILRAMGKYKKWAISLGYSGRKYYGMQRQSW